MNYSDAAFIQILLWIPTDAVNYRNLHVLLLIVSNIYLPVSLMNECDRLLEQIRILHPSIRQLCYVGLVCINYGGTFFTSVMLYFADMNYTRKSVDTARRIGQSIDCGSPTNAKQAENATKH